MVCGIKFNKDTMSTPENMIPMDEIVPGYDEYRESLFEKLIGPLDDYILCKLKQQQLCAKRGGPITMKLVHNKMMAAKDRISEILIQEKDLP